jgi:hypothetical protein
MSRRHQVGSWINQPFTVGVLVVLATFFTQQWGWKQQQRFLAEQADAGLAIKERKDAIKETTLAVDRVLTASAMILGAHREGVDVAQMNETIDKYHDLQREWDLQEDLLKHTLRNSFPYQDVGTSWSRLLDGLGELDLQVGALHRFPPSESSQEHTKQIESVARLIKK